MKRHDRAMYVSSLSKRITAGALLLLTVLSACDKQTELRPDCAIDAGPCTRTVEGITVMLDITPKPVRAMRDLEFRLQLSRGVRAVVAEDVEISLTMPEMTMGENRVRLVRESSGRYRGRGVIVRCPSGQRLWKASVPIGEDGRVIIAEFLFEAP